MSGDYPTEEQLKEMYRTYAGVCKTLAHPTRLMILDLLRDGEKSVDELAKAIGVGKSNLSQHLALMRERRVLKYRRQGLNILYSIDNVKILDACDKLRQLMVEQFAKTNEIVSAGDEKETEGEGD